MQITTKNLFLVPAKRSMHKNLHKNFFGDRPSTKAMLWRPVQTLAESLPLMEDLLVRSKDGHAFAILLQNQNKPIGRIHVVLDEENRRIGKSIGVGIGSKFSSKGYGEEAVEAFIEYCFNTLGLTEVNSSYFPENTASEKLFRRLGFQPTGEVFLLKPNSLDKLTYLTVKLTREDFFKKNKEKYILN